MTFYQELQLNQVGSKKLIRETTDKREKVRHTLIYLFKIAITVAFCFFFVAAFSILFGNANSVAGVAVLLCVMVFKSAHFGVNLRGSCGLIAFFYILMIVGPHTANTMGPAIGFFVNLFCIGLMVILGCHIPLMSNQSTIVLSYLLLYGYDVSGEVLHQRTLGLIVGGILTIIVFYRNHKHMECDTRIPSLIGEFDLHTDRSRWQLCLSICVPLTILISELCQVPRSMWAGIATMSVIIPQMTTVHMRGRDRLIGNICGVLVFFLLYHLLPPSLYANIGILGGIGVGLSATYGWQAVFNTFGALAIAAESFGLTDAIWLRVVQNAYGIAIALLICFVLVKTNFLSKEKAGSL